MITIIIPRLRCASKKNNPKLIRRGRITYRIPSNAYENFKSLVGEYLLPHQGGITKPFRIHVAYTIKGKYHQDIDNVVTSLLDVLKDYQVIPDDDLCLEMSATKCNGKEWLIDVSLEEIEEL